MTCKRYAGGNISLIQRDEEQHSPIRRRKDCGSEPSKIFLENHTYVHCEFEHSSDPSKRSLGVNLCDINCYTSIGGNTNRSKKKKCEGDENNFFSHLDIL